MNKVICHFKLLILFLLVVNNKQRDINHTTENIGKTRGLINFCNFKCLIKCKSFSPSLNNYNPFIKHKSKVVKTIVGSFIKKCIACYYNILCCYSLELSIQTPKICFITDWTVIIQTKFRDGKQRNETCWLNQTSQGGF